MRVLLVGGDGGGAAVGAVNVPGDLQRAFEGKAEVIRLPIHAGSNAAAAGVLERRAGGLLPGLRFLPSAMRWVMPWVPGLKDRAFYLRAHLVDAARVAAVLDDFKPDVVHVHSLNPQHVPAIEACLRLGVPVVVTVHLPYSLDPSETRPFRTSLEPHLLRTVQARGGHVTFVSRKNHDRLVDAYGLAPAGLHVVNNGTWPRPVEPVSQDGKRHLVQVGALVPRKNHAAVLEALALMADDWPEDLVFDIVGEGPLRASLEADIAKRGLQHRVRFHGRLPWRELAAMMAAAEGLVLPSLLEGQALVMLDALSAGTPVLTFDDLDGVADAADATAFQVVHRDPASLAQGIRDLLATPWDREAIRELAAHHAWPAVADAYLSVYRAAMASPPSPGPVAVRPRTR